MNYLLYGLGSKGVCVVSHRQQFASGLSFLFQRNKLGKEGSSDVVDSFSDIGGALVSRLLGAYRWQPDTSLARRSTDRARG